MKRAWPPSFQPVVAAHLRQALVYLMNQDAQQRHWNKIRPFVVELDTLLCKMSDGHRFYDPVIWETFGVKDHMLNQNVVQTQGKGATQ